MGNRFSKKTTRDSYKKESLNNNPNSDGRPMSIWDYNSFPNPFPEPDNTGLYDKIYLASFYNPRSGYFCGHLFILGFQSVDGDNEQREYRHSFLFFKFDTKPTKITIQKQTNGELKISFIGDGNIILFVQVWFSSEYKLSKDGRDLISIVKKKMIDGVSSDIPMIDESALASEIVQSDNGAGASGLRADVPRHLVNSQDDGSATHAPEVVESDNGTGASLMVDRDRLNTTFGTSTSQLNKITDIDIEQRQTFAPCGPMPPLKKETGPNVEDRQTFAPCGPPPSGTRTYPCLVTQFSGKGNTITFSVSDDDDCRSITYLNNSGEIQSVSLGVSKDTIKKINVYEICSGIYLILIHATNGLVYVSGYTNQRTAKSLTPLCVNNSFSENPKEFQKIEFLPPKTADNGSELQNRDFKLIFSRSLSKMYNINSNGELNRIPNTLK